jgi:hypothetical protein
MNETTLPAVSDLWVYATAGIVEGDLMATLQRYERPRDFADFADFDRREYFTLGGQHRDSDTLTRSNHRSILKALGGESDTVRVVRDSHWAVGWVEAIYVHQADHKALGIAKEITDKLEDYPVLDESDWSELEYETAADYWASMRVEDRLYYCQKHDVSVFAARRSELPEDDRGELISHLADGC